MALLELADALGLSLHLLGPVPDEIDASVGRWPDRWLPVLRRLLTLGDDPRARSAAVLLDRHGTAQDVGVLRAYEKTYRRRAAVAGLGRGLVKRVSPRLEIHDLGQVTFSVENRVTKLSRVRRRSAAVLAYLISRPNFTATREQIIEDIWPDGDISGGSNSLNQSLYFLRREIDPWYEDDISPEYVTFESELVWLDENLVRVDSVEFVKRSRELMGVRLSFADATSLVETYRGQFAPEFEYEEWALSWRSRVHAAYLDFARHAVAQLSSARELRAACDIALRALAVDAYAEDIERSLIWLYWRSGATSAAEAQYGHWAGRQRADGLDAASLGELVGRATPT
jgi:DNA-binding SARP family transcriptional activator